MIRYMKEMWKRKDLVSYLVVTGLKAENRNTALGYLWWLLDPFLNILIYYFLVAVIMKRGSPDYSPFLVVGMIVFRYFSTTVSMSCNAILSHSGIITQVYLPKAIFAVGTTLSQTINFLFGLLIVEGFMLFFHRMPGIQLVCLPLIILVQLLFQLAIAMFLSYICIFIRDFKNVVGHIIMILHFIAPVIWEVTFLPEKYQWVVRYDPIAWLLQAYRDVFMYGRFPDFRLLAVLMGFSVAAILGLLWFFDKNEHKIVKAL
ncbi:MAG: ABC transporter permease [Spirochaetia bacterium]|nr:ABC transporter permease [Spirochaetia bacterium]